MKATLLIACANKNYAKQLNSGYDNITHIEPYALTLISMQNSWNYISTRINNETTYTETIIHTIYPVSNYNKQIVCIQNITYKLTFVRSVRRLTSPTAAELVGINYCSLPSPRRAAGYSCLVREIYGLGNIVWDLIQVRSSWCLDCFVFCWASPLHAFLLIYPRPLFFFQRNYSILRMIYRLYYIPDNISGFAHYFKIN